MAYGTDKDNPVLGLRAGYQPYTIGHMLFSSDARREEQAKGRAWRGGR